VEKVSSSRKKLLFLALKRPACYATGVIFQNLETGLCRQMADDFQSLPRGRQKRLGTPLKLERDSVEIRLDN
jgi:hypothetical protein